METIKIGTRTVGGDNPCFIIAEAGVNHNGDPAIARQLIDIAAEAGADAVKFQTFNASKTVTATASKAKYQIQNDTSGGSQADMLRRLELSADVFAELAEYCTQSGILFMSTAFDHESLDVVAALKPAALKWPSGEINNFPLIDHAAGLGLPIILSTGMATVGEIEAAIRRFEAKGQHNIVLLHCVSDYPAAPEDLNLRAIATLGSTFRKPVGYSDHSMGSFAAIAARALGMCVYEKHYTVDRTLPGPDHKASLEPAELTDLIAQLRDLEAALGDGVKRPRPVELETATVARRSLYAVRDIKAGETLDASAIQPLRPAGGLSPALWDEVIGAQGCKKYHCK